MTEKSVLLMNMGIHFAAAAHFRLSILSFQAFLPTTVGWPGEMVEIQLWTGNKVGMKGSGRYFDQ